MCDTFLDNTRKRCIFAVEYKKLKIRCTMTYLNQFHKICNHEQ